MVEEVSNSILDVIQNPPPDIAPTGTVTNFGGWKMGCAIYLNEETCYRCYADKYLNTATSEYNKTCLDVKKPVANC